jgi:hypothetical protein
MWMKSRFATWEAEGQVEERIQRALCEGKRWRLGRMATMAQAGHSRARFLSSVSKRLPWLGKRATGWLANQTDAAVHRPVPAKHNRGEAARAKGL